MNTTTTTTRLNDSSTTKKAHAIRKSTAAKFGVPNKFVGFSDCMRKARGENVGQMTDCFGNTLGSKASKLNLWLLSDECPVAFTKEELVSLRPQTGGGKVIVDQHMTALIKMGRVIATGLGRYTHVLKGRPYQPLTKSSEATFYGDVA
jgi:hypothetical protein